MSHFVLKICGVSRFLPPKGLCPRFTFYPCRPLVGVHLKNTVKNGSKLVLRQQPHQWKGICGEFSLWPEITHQHLIYITGKFVLHCFENFENIIESKVYQYMIKNSWCGKMLGTIHVVPHQWAILNFPASIYSTTGILSLLLHFLDLQTVKYWQR